MRGGWVEVICPKCRARGRSRLAKAKEAVKCNQCRAVIQWTAPGQFKVLPNYVKRPTEPATELPPLALGFLAAVGAGVGAVCGIVASLVLGLGG